MFDFHTFCAVVMPQSDCLIFVLFCFVSVIFHLEGAVVLLNQTANLNISDRLLSNH